ncbi:MAG: PQQ-binding-like beta-propeller repeat protein, partial [Planctomycetales bacterium]|nr:PQQ-binding-like beta-propeller repeat protein [Planctomycetales bacterium]
ADARGLPTTWSDQQNVVWKIELPGAGASTPVVYGDHIYLTAFNGYLVPGQPQGKLDDLVRSLICIDRNSGSFIWQKTVAAVLPEEESIRDHGYAANSAVVDEDHVYAFLGKSGVYAFDHHGNQVWNADVGTRTHGWGTAASPVLYKDLVLINASVESESLIALNRTTGEPEWSVDGIKEAWNTPLVAKSADGTDELVISVPKRVIGLDPATGKQLWSCDSEITWYMVPSPVAADGVVYVFGGRSGTASLAIRLGGRGDVTGTHRLWTSMKGSNVTSPIYHDGHLYWMHDQIGIAYCASAETGELRYEQRMNRGGQVYASSLLADGKVYYTNRSGRTFVVDAKPEFSLVATNDLGDGGQFNASPVVTGKRILIRSDRFLYCLGE